MGNEEHYKWLISFMAHIFQYPGEKPRVSLVFQGDKGTGKTIVSEILNHLIGDNSVILADKNQVLGHFNSMIEDKLLVTLDEAFWAGDKQSEGALKHVITGGTRNITYKGAESYKAKVFDRIIIIGNEPWLIPASSDERRYAVFKVGNGRRQDQKFFGALKDGILKHGGDKLLMKFFMEWDLSAVDINSAPNTEGLAEQKDQSLDIFHQWWFDCLQEGQILGTGKEEWPEEISNSTFYHAFLNQASIEHRRNYLPSKIAVTKMLQKITPSCMKKYHKQNSRGYIFATLEIARKDWDNHRGFITDWGA
jgi:hypothetical protein